MFPYLQSARGFLLFNLALTFALSYAVPGRARADFFRRTSLGAIVHWGSDAVRLPVDPALSRRFGPAIHDALEAARLAWDLGGPVPALELTQEVSDEDLDRAIEENGNWIGFAPNWTFGDKLAVTVSTFDAETGALVSAQIWINPELELGLIHDGVDDTRLYDLQGVLTHEFGHVLGLGEADQAPEATMYPTFKRGETRQRTLSLTDAEAVDALYTTVSLGQGPVSKCSSTSSAHPNGRWTLLFAVVAWLLALRRLPRPQCGAGLTPLAALRAWLDPEPRDAPCTTRSQAEGAFAAGSKPPQDLTRVLFLREPNP